MKKIFLMFLIPFSITVALASSARASDYGPLCSKGVAGAIGTSFYGFFLRQQPSLKQDQSQVYLSVDQEIARHYRLRCKYIKTSTDLESLLSETRDLCQDSCDRTARKFFANRWFNGIRQETLIQECRSICEMDYTAQLDLLKSRGRIAVARW